jgi:hypothetical protein
VVTEADKAAWPVPAGSSSTNGETRLTDDGLRADVQLLDSRVRGSLPTPLTQSVDSVDTALEHRLDTAIGSISDPAGHARGLGFTPTTLAEEDSLDIATYDDTTSDHDCEV